MQADHAHGPSDRLVVAAGTCPACVAGRAAASRVVAGLAAGQGPLPALCARHGQSFGLQAPREWLERLAAREARNWVEGRVPRRMEPCLACETERAAAAAVAATLAGSPEGENSDVCWRHLRAALVAAGPHAARTSLARAVRSQLEALAAELERYSLLLDYHYRDLPRGPEQEAWRRALLRFGPPESLAAIPSVMASRPVRVPDGVDDVGRVHALFLLGPGGCPVCAQARRVAATHLRWFLLDNYNSLATVLTLRRGGYCPPHAGLLWTLPVAQLSVTFEALVAAALVDLRAGVPPAETEGCPACRAADNAAVVAVADLRALWGVTWGREALAAGPTLCRPHALLWLDRLHGQGWADAARVWAAALQRSRDRGPAAVVDALWGGPSVPSPRDVHPRDEAMAHGRRTPGIAGGADCDGNGRGVGGR